MSEVLIRALADAQARLDKRERKLQREKRDSDKYIALIDGLTKCCNDQDTEIARLIRERDLAKVDERDAEELALQADDRARALEAELAARDTEAEDKLRSVHDAVYGHGHEYSTILWKIRQVVGPE